MLVQQLHMLGNIAVVKIGDAEIQQDIEKECEIEQVLVKSIIREPDRILHRPVNAEDPERLDQQVQQDQECQVEQEFFLHEMLMADLNNRID